MSYRVTPTDPSMAPDGFALFRDAYLRARRANPLVPPLTREHQARLRGRVERAFAHGGVVAWRGASLAGYMVAGPPFEMRGLVASLVPEYGHAAGPTPDDRLHGELYAAMAERLVQDGVHLHLIGHFAHDGTTRANLFELGFGGLVAERLRDLTDVPVASPAGTEDGALRGRIERMPDETPWDSLAPLATEHAAYYRGSPIFVAKDEALGAAAADLEEHRRVGDALFVYREGREDVAYLVAGACPGTSEGRLLAGTRTAQIRAAYAAPAMRRHGIGSALLQRAVTWARAEGFERMFVEHETANLEGGPFWRRHFTPFLEFSMRYVDRTL